MYRKRRILVIDDADTKAIKIILERFGYEVFLAEDGFIALALLDELTYEFRLPDLIFVDTMMPGMHGIDLTKRIKENHETRDIPIVLWNSQLSADLVMAAMEAGCIDCYSDIFNLKNIGDYLHKLFKNIEEK